MVNEFDNFDDLEAAIEQQIDLAPPPPEDHLTRYGMMMLINLPIHKHTSNNTILKLNERAGTRGEVLNNSYLPRFVLLPFKNLEVSVPAEAPASRTSKGDYADHARVFSASGIEADSLNRRVAKSARLCADEFRNLYAPYGGAIFDSLTGVEETKRAKEMFSNVLPLRDRDFFPITQRAVLGEVFNAPFLDQILNFLQTEAMERIAKIVKSDADEMLYSELYKDVYAACQAAANAARTRIDETEGQILASPQEKKGYDLRDHRFKSAPEPFDLLCLAQLNLRPKSERQLEDARKLNAEQNAPLNEAAQALTAAAQAILGNANNLPQQIATPGGDKQMIGMTQAELIALVNKSVADAVARDRAERAASEGGAGKSGATETAPQTQNTDETVPAKDNKPAPRARG